MLGGVLIVGLLRQEGEADTLGISPPQQVNDDKIKHSQPFAQGQEKAKGCSKACLLYTSGVDKQGCKIDAEISCSLFPFFCTDKQHSRHKTKNWDKRFYAPAPGRPQNKQGDVKQHHQFCSGVKHKSSVLYACL